MVPRMKTTLEIDATVMRALKRRAAEEGRTMSELVEAALRAVLFDRRESAALPPLPSFDSGGELVDVADREALDRAMER